MRFERLREPMSMLSVREENLLKLMLLKENEEEIPMNELRGDIIKMVDYHDSINVWKACAVMMIDREQAMLDEQM